ncbi:type II secretion system minor pseudopilin GspJ [Gallaecimonas sp. GXIMD4217]|uniref:type II secretion system minor pseudopilin GspJ n=1 Tax=Gallaecimonas sp. GXIMD4217 TaxID=3131927 RepID=UPI00311B2A6B
MSRRSSTLPEVFGNGSQGDGRQRGFTLLEVFGNGSQGDGRQRGFTLLEVFGNGSQGVGRQHGFTLLEVLIAISIFAMVGLASFQVLDQVLKSDESSARKTAQLKALQQAFFTMERDFMQLSPRKARFPDGERQQAALLSQDGLLESEGGAIAFTRLGWINPAAMLPRAEVQLAGYRLAEGRLERLHYLYPDPDYGQEPQRLSLLEGVDKLAFRFFDGEHWVTSWDKPVLPRLLAVQLTLDGYGEIERRFMVPEGATVERQAQNNGQGNGQNNPGSGRPNNPNRGSSS